MLLIDFVDSAAPVERKFTPTKMKNPNRINF